MKKNRQKTFQFDIATVNENPVHVVVTPYIAVDKQRFRVSYNGGPVHIFGVDDVSHEVMYMDGAASSIAPEIKSAIEEELQEYVLQLAA
ncbi:hypothetical protein [Pinibacter soli]|uniref:DUF3467 domain-containing protein n=1 Tax=Pinibacter soli TaxID=3044211 RepID=A0ABT6R8E6_9BACT|nr:hypothetical protein [Pinibacter soli]MDI3318763.1 hypothetical protein [Pinibacter soli]